MWIWSIRILRKRTKSLQRSWKISTRIKNIHLSCSRVRRTRRERAGVRIVSKVYFIFYYPSCPNCNTFYFWSFCYDSMYCLRIRCKVSDFSYLCVCSTNQWVSIGKALITIRCDVRSSSCTDLVPNCFVTLLVSTGRWCLIRYVFYHLRLHFLFFLLRSCWTCFWRSIPFDFISLFALLCSSINSKINLFFSIAS